MTIEQSGKLNKQNTNSKAIKTNAKRFTFFDE